ncbi:energy-coupling factor ABC transporter permease [Aestuariibacter sp. A3R04]|uniref:energy-coupling factor ABC transporter permease n=1 Tax=Aestuariibacter sp. A3R04 TaxID=2841571 RepID=UPI001C08B434|nr:energy-coupling factor ABC transporter permease [Aestuariibacter sp. A3R04]
MTTIQTCCVFAYAIVLLRIVKSLSWSALLSDKARQHVIFGFTAIVFFLWIFRAGIYTGLSVHFLWLSALVLTLGFRWACMAGSVALLGTTLAGADSWEMMGVNGLVGVLMPISVTYLIFITAFHRISRNVFVYIFVCAFLPGALVIALKMSLLATVYWTEGIYDWATVRDNYLILIPLLLFPEGLLNGMTMTLLVVYKPQWVFTFHDKFYISGK